MFGRKKQSGSDSTKISTAQPHNKKRILIITGITATVVVLLLLAIVQFTSLFRPSSRAVAEKTSNKFLTNIQKKQTHAAYEQFSTKAKALTSQKDFEALVGSPSSLKKVESKTIDKDASSQSQTVEYDVTDASGEKYRLILTVVQENGEWKILNFTKSFQ